MKLAALLLTIATAFATFAGGPPVRLDEAKAEIARAMPFGEMLAKAEKPRRLLVFWKTEGFCHGDSIALGNETLRVAAEKTKAFEVDFSNDYETLRPENLSKYDALVLNNTTCMKTKIRPWLVPGLIEFVEKGKGIAAIHAGVDNFYEDDRGASLMGGRFVGHPWVSRRVWSFVVEDKESPLTKMFSSSPFKANDEIYVQANPFFDRTKLHVLIAMDLADKATADALTQRKSRRPGGVWREDGDYAVSWIRRQGQGRIFYTSFGHDTHAWLDKAVLRHILSGIQFVLGDVQDK